MYLPEQFSPQRGMLCDRREGGKNFPGYPFLQRGLATARQHPAEAEVGKRVEDIRGPRPKYF